MKPSYIIIIEDQLDWLEDKVNKKIEISGYAPAGGVMIMDRKRRKIGETLTMPRGLTFAQAMYKKPVKVVKSRPSKSDYPSVFEKAWKIYPKRAGSNPKKKAYSAWNARFNEGVSSNAIQRGVKRYYVFCHRTGKLNTEFVMQAATFFGPDKHFENDWTVPKTHTGVTNIPDKELEAWSVKRGGPKPSTQDDWKRYRKRVEEWAQKR